MTKLPLIIEKNGSKTKINNLRNLKRSYNFMVIDSFTPQLGRLLKRLKIFSPSTLELNYAELGEEFLVDFLKSNGKLVKLVMTNCYQQKINDPPVLSSLKSLSVTDSSWNILIMMSLCKNIQDLKISSKSISDRDKYDLTDFMAGQEKLKTLVITNYFPLDVNAVIDAKYNLKQLSVRQHVTYKVDWKPHLLQMMERHKDTLENLEICVKGENFMEFIMKNLKVRRLFTKAALLPTNHQVYKKIQPNLHLKKLIIGGLNTNSQALQGLFQTYPTIESLIIKNWQPNVINEALIGVANTLKSIILLHIPMLTFDTPDAPMPSLRTFNIDFVQEIENFLAFCFNIHSVEHLAIKWSPAAVFTIANIQIMTSRLPQLRHIKFGMEYELTSEMLDVFRANCAQLRLIEMPNNSDNSKINVTHGKIQVVFFSHCYALQVFKDEKTLWNQNEDEDDEDEVEVEINDGYEDYAPYDYESFEEYMDRNGQPIGVVNGPYIPPHIAPDPDSIAEYLWNIGYEESYEEF